MSNYFEQLLERRLPVVPTTNCHDVYEIFMREPDALCIPVVDGMEVLGLVNRQDFLLRYTYQLGPDLYGKRPITQLMDSNPLVVDRGMAFEDLGNRIVKARAGGLLGGFVVTEDGQYFGVGTALSLLRLMLDVSERRSDALEIERQRVEQANRSKTEFLASMSHELRTPLNAIIGFTDFMMSEPFGPVQPARYGEYVVDVNRSANHLLGLINELLDMAKIEAGKMELCEEEFPASQPVDEALQILKQSISDAGLKLKVDLADADVHLFADQKMAVQVMLNLLSNAIKFTPVGGTISVRSIRTDDGFDVIVSDTGIGIPPDHLERILQPFEQVETAMSRTKPGTGLGLPLAKAMIEAHGGMMSIASSLGKGTQITIHVPNARVVRAAPPQCPQSTAA
ncbi:sensor histidine kinase [Pyruvatibacter sp. HU-CL02332]|uniref:sensor histidine kinase n=1 Tax=Pyruvatibacter sp. HU-CL02332 TaxID=3127650 RepID=UPI00310B094D